MTSYYEIFCTLHACILLYYVFAFTYLIIKHRYTGFCAHVFGITKYRVTPSGPKDWIVLRSKDKNTLCNV